VHRDARMYRKGLETELLFAKQPTKTGAINQEEEQRQG